MNDNDKTKTELVMENVHLRRKLAEAERKLDMAKEARQMLMAEVAELNGKLTHRVPDSWERLEEDAEKMYCDYFGFGGKLCSGCPAEHSEIDCSSVKMFDLLRRAKALAGIEVE